MVQDALVCVGPKQTVFNRFLRRHLEPLPSELARSAKSPNMKFCSGRETSPWTASLPMIEGAIKPYGDGTMELSMKAPMSVSKPADLG